MFEKTFKNIDDILWKEAGCTTELDYTEQASWMLFLKYLDDLIDHVNRELFPYLQGFKQRATWRQLPFLTELARLVYGNNEASVRVIPSSSASKRGKSLKAREQRIFGLRHIKQLL